MNTNTGQNRAAASLLKLRAFWSKVKVPPEQDRRAAERRRAHAVEAPASATVNNAERKERQRALLERQSRREKSGFYEGTPSVASMLGQRRDKLVRQVDDETHAVKPRKKVVKGQRDGRWIRRVGDYVLHATKGWRHDREAA